MESLGIKLNVYGRGKCLGRGTDVLCFDGAVKPVEEIEVDDQLMGPDSQPRTVLSLHEGIGPLYRIVPTKGDSWICNDAHILTLTGTCQMKGKVRDVSVMDYLTEVYEEKPYSAYWRLFRVSVLFGEAKELEVPPYLVGLWLGDGKRGSSDITNNSKIIQDYCAQAATDLGLQCRIIPGRNTATITFAGLGSSLGGLPGRSGRNLLRTFFRDQCSTEGRITKRIPQKYLTASASQRRELLAGIIDTDGESRPYSYTTVNVTGEAYRDGLLFLCRSLGFAAYAGQPSIHVCTNGKVSTYYSISISGDLSALPTKVRKFGGRKQEKRVTVTGFEIEDAGDGEFFGFELDGDGRFLLGDFTVTHNTGKTRMACTFPKPLLLIGTEDGTKSICNGRMANRSLACGAVVQALTMRKEPTGVHFVRLETPDWMDEIVEYINGHDYQSVVLDHGGGLQDMITKQVLRLTEMPVQRNWGMAQQQDWGIIGAQTKERLRQVLALSETKGMNIVIIAHERNFKDDSSSDMMLPTIGAALTPSVVGWLNGACDYVAQTFIRREEKEEDHVLIEGQPPEKVRVPTGKVEYCLRVGPHPIVMTGFRLPEGFDLPDVLVNPTFAKIYQLIQGE